MLRIPSLGWRVQETVHLGRLENDAMIEVDTTFSTQHRVSYLGFHREGLVVGDDLNSLMFYDLDGKPR